MWFLNLFNDPVTTARLDKEKIKMGDKFGRVALYSSILFRKECGEYSKVSV
jgi:hypothetical protein